MLIYIHGFNSSPASHKANLLRDLLQRQANGMALGAEEVRTVADLCVNCKMCAIECPARVNIPKLMLEAKAAHVAEHGLDRSDWVRNLMANPEVTLEVGEERRATTARVLDPGSDQDALARRLLVQRYRPGHGEDLSAWGRTALPVAIDWG